MGQQAERGQRRQPGWVSREDRTPIALEGTARRQDGTSMAVTLHDLSREGCRVDCNGTTLGIGEWLELDAPGCGQNRAQVRWALLGSAGLRFAGH